MRGVINEEDGHITVVFIMASHSLNVLITWLENFQILRQFPFMVSQFDSTVTNQFPQDDILKSDNCDNDFLSTSLSPKMSSWFEASSANFCVFKRGSKNWTRRREPFRTTQRVAGCQNTPIKNLVITECNVTPPPLGHFWGRAWIFSFFYSPATAWRVPSLFCCGELFSFFHFSRENIG